MGRAMVALVVGTPDGPEKYSVSDPLHQASFRPPSRSPRRVRPRGRNLRLFWPKARDPVTSREPRALLFRAATETRPWLKRSRRLRCSRTSRECSRTFFFKLRREGVTYRQARARPRVRRRIHARASRRPAWPRDKSCWSWSRRNACSADGPGTGVVVLDDEVAACRIQGLVLGGVPPPPTIAPRTAPPGIRCAQVRVTT